MSNRIDELAVKVRQMTAYPPRPVSYPRFTLAEEANAALSELTSLARRGERLREAVADDGAGFALAAKRGLSLHLTPERVATIVAALDTEGER